MLSVAVRLIRWQARHGRHDLPWQSAPDPYRVWLSEIMLQQTQVATVVPYYERFLRRFGDVRALAAAPRAEVMQLWSGLGYYARARHLHDCAQRVVAAHGGVFPRTAAELARLPGIGASTAAAIAAFCFGQRAAILDGNVKRVLARYLGVEGFPGAPAVERSLWKHADELLPARTADMPAYTQALMDLGATICVRRTPRCSDCPLRGDCRALATGRVDVLPTPRAARPLPVRRAHWLILVHRRAVLLQQRPAAGLWEGLLAPPQFESAAGLQAALHALAPDSKAGRLQARSSSFTHFKLTVTPHLARAARLAAHVAEPGQIWLPLSEIETAALPAPVRVLLLGLRGRIEVEEGAGKRADPLLPRSQRGRQDRRRGGLARPSKATI